MNYRYSKLSKGLNILIDFFLLNLALYAGFAFVHPDLIGQDITEDHKLDFLFLNLVWFYCSNVTNLYEDIFRRDAIPTINATLKALGLYLLIGLLLKLSLKQFDLPNSLITLSFVVFSVLLLSWKTLFLLIRRPARWSLVKYKTIVIVGAGALGLDLYNHLKMNKQLGYKVLGFFDDDLSKCKKGLRVLGKVEDCFDFVEENNIAEVYCALPDVAQEKIKCLMLEADKRLIRFKLVPEVKDYRRNFNIELFGHLPILTPRKEPLEDKANEIIKRGFDVVFSSFVIVLLLSWFVPLMALIIKLDSKGPVFFRQIRSGKDNRPFYCLKFRSMHVNGDSDKKQACKGDVRITRVGAFIRKTSIDELPQFFNVLMGDMSVVGPRPHMLKHTEDYSNLIDKFMVRHFLTPGITGWAQVNGHRGETTNPVFMERRIEADIWYLENWSFLLDLKIVVLTAWQTIRGNDNAF
ncbi:undecaprenyl-phosphate glucose phosphotransferase [Pontibacter cellulosilyticus]|uniref:Undecaprenyl-phosphate glucose phosphotransferase n=1 Tax=Pontibacter cellulosilyticus TaxID=1720253 RepID=A0A923N5D7_9BACT|nr:undecaprenyl-phosphate glucose phosphotransferase [Pontibacter cellulosilyticus]MBC5992526.1 undecaprenyl-phosphate glucose phosphotransferase [Pontibacter cellulosilyticus]